MPAHSYPDADPLHELNNLLGVVIGACEWLADSLEARSESAEVARAGLLAAERACDAAQRLGADRRPPRAAADAKRPSTRSVAARPAGTVLLADDDVQFLALMEAAFRKSGFKVDTARNGRAALQLIAERPPNLLITDIVMPEVEGLATIRAARRDSPGLPVIAISGGGQYGRSGAFLTWAEGLGADEVLAKPFKMSSLVAAAHDVLDRRRARPTARALAV